SNRHLRTQVRAQAGVKFIGDQVQVAVRIPAHVPQQRQGHVLVHVHAMSEVGVDGRLHQLVGKRDGVPVRNGGAWLNRVGSVEQGAAETIRSRAPRNV